MGVSVGWLAGGLAIERGAAAVEPGDLDPARPIASGAGA
jgi:hypothetical protein